MRSKFIISPGLFNWDPEKTAEDKNCEISTLEPTQAQKKLENISSNDFYTFENLVMLFKQADSSEKKYKFTATEPIIQLLSYINKYKKKLSEDDLQEIFNRFDLNPRQLVRVLKKYPNLAKHLPADLLLAYAEHSAILAEYIMNNKDLRNKIKARQPNKVIDYQDIYEKILKNNRRSLWWADRAEVVDKENALDLFLTSWDNFLTLKWRRPRYIEKLTKENVASLFALANTKEKSIDVFYYFCSHTKTRALFKEFLEESSSSKYIAILMACENLGHNYLSRYPSLVQAIYDKKPEEFAKSLCKINDLERILQILKANLYWLTAEHFICICEKLYIDEVRAAFLKQRFVRDKLRVEIDRMITMNDSINNKDITVIVRALKQRDLREVIDLTRKRSKDGTNYINCLMWKSMKSKESAYNVEIAKIVACDAKLLCKVGEGDWQLDPHIKVARNIRQEIQKKRGLFISGKSAFVKSFIKQTNYFFDPRSITEETKAICLIIADDPDLFERLTSIYIGRRRFFGLFGPSEQEMAERRQKLESFSKYFKAKFNRKCQSSSVRQVVEEAINDLKQVQADPLNHPPRSAAAAAVSAEIIIPALSSHQILHSNSTSSASSFNESFHLTESVSELTHEIFESNSYASTVVTDAIATMANTTDGAPVFSSSPRFIINSLSSSASAASFDSEVQSIGSVIEPMIETLPRISQHYVKLEKLGRYVDCSGELCVSEFNSVLSFGKPDKKMQEMIYRNNRELVKNRYDRSFKVGKEIVTDELRRYWFLYKNMFDEMASKGALQAADLNEILKINTPESQSWFATYYNAHANNKAYIKHQFRFLTDQRHNADEVVLFLGLAGDEVFVVENLKGMLKLFDQNGKTLQGINKALDELFKANQFLAMEFLDCADQNIVNNNINLFLPLLENSNVTLVRTPLLKLYRTHNPQVIRSIFSSSRYCSEIKISDRNVVSESDLNIAIECILSLNGEFHADLQSAKSIIGLFSYEEKSEFLSRRIRLLAFDDLLNRPALVAAILEDVNQCYAVFIKDQHADVIHQHLHALYSLGNETITVALFKLRHTNGFKIQQFNSNELLKLYQKNPVFTDLICGEVNWFGTFERGLSDEQLENYYFKFLQKANANGVEHYFANVSEHKWLKKPPCLMTLLRTNPHFARQSLMNPTIRNQLNLGHDHFVFTYYQFLNKPEVLASFLSAYDKEFVGEVLVAAINNGDLDRIQLILNGKLPEQAYIDIAYNKIRPIQLDNELAWAKTKDAIATVDLIFARLFPGRARETRAESVLDWLRKHSSVQDDGDLTSLAANYLENPLHCFTNLNLLKTLARDSNTIIAMAITSGIGSRAHEVAKTLTEIEPIASDQSLAALRELLFAKAKSLSATENAAGSASFFRNSERSQSGAVDAQSSQHDYARLTA